MVDRLCSWVKAWAFSADFCHNAIRWPSSPRQNSASRGWQCKMLSQHSVQRDHHGIPIVSRRTKVAFYDDTLQECMVSVERLERCNIPWGRSNDLVMLTGGKTYSDKHADGVECAFSWQILVYGCVPAYCLVAKFTIQRFVSFAGNEISEVCT